MAITTIDDKHLTNIATAIRQKRGIEDTFKPSEMASAIKDISGGKPILQEVVVQPSISEQTITPSADYDGLSQVKIGAVTRLIDSSIQPENIKKDVEILGVIGTIEDKPAEPVLQNKIVEPNIGKQIITADSGYDGLGQVEVNAVTSKIDSNIKADNIKQGVSILGVQGTIEPGAEVVKKYAPKYVSFRSSPAIDLTEETRMIDTANMTSIAYMFSSAKATSVDVSGWNTSNITDMNSAFYYAEMASLNVSTWDTSKVTIMNSMFGSMSKLTTLDLSNFNTSNVTDMSSMFSYSSKLTSLNLSSFDTSKVTTMAHMFESCGLKEYDLSHFNTYNVTDMNMMFRSFGGSQLDLSSFTNKGRVGISAMFQNCKYLQKLDMRNFTFNVCSSYSYMFENVPTTCLIIVKDDTEKAWLNSKFKSYTNVKTLAEYQAEGGV